MKKRTRPRFISKDNSLSPKQWILVAQRAEAQIFEREGNKRPTLVEKLENLDGKKKPRQLGTDRPGRGFSSSTAKRSALSKEVSQEEHVANIFAKSIAVKLEQARGREQFERLAVVGDSRFIGRVLSRLSSPTQKRINGIFNSNFSGISGGGMRRKLSTLLEAVA